LSSYVILSVYRNDNPEHFALAVQSIKNTEHLLIGVDGPIPTSLDAALSIASKRLRVKVIRFSGNRGLAYILNDLTDYALRDPSCEFIFRMDADDISHPDRFECQTAFMRSNPNVGVAGSWAKTIDEDGNVIGEIRKPTDDRVLKHRLAYDSPFVHPSVVLRASTLREGWRYPTDTIRFEDVSLWARMACAGVKFSNVEAHLLYYRQSLRTNVRRTGVRKSWSEFQVRRAYIFEFMPWRVDALVLALAILISKVLLPSHSFKALYAARKIILRS